MSKTISIIIILFTSAICFAQKVILTLPSGSGSGSLTDTTSLSNRLNLKVDSVISRNDSIFYWQHGNEYFVHKGSTSIFNTDTMGVALVVLPDGVKRLLPQVGIALSDGPQSVGIALDTAGGTALTQQRATNTYAGLNANNTFSTKNTFKSMFADKDSIPYSTGIQTVMIFDTITGQFKKENLGGTYWTTTGNAGTEYNTNFIGTTDNIPVTFRSNNVLQMQLNANGYALEVRGNSTIGVVNIRPNFPISGKSISIRSEATHGNSFSNRNLDGGNGQSGQSYNFVAVNGSGEVRFLRFAGSTINQPSGDGTVIGIDYNPTITSLTGQHYAATFRTGQVGIGNGAPNASAALDITSITRGLLTPRMTSAQRTDITSPAAGLHVTDTDSSRPFFFTGAAWKGLAFTSDAGGGGGQQHLFYNGLVRSFYSTNSIAAANGGESPNMRNVAIGDSVLRSITTGINNIAFGYNSMRQSTTATQNIAIGLSAMQQATTSYNSIAIGAEALFNGGNSNIAIGAGSLAANTTGSINVGLGQSTLESIGAGSLNVALGGLAGVYAKGNGHIYIGYNTGPQFGGTISYDNVVIGRNTGANIKDYSECIYIGSSVTGLTDIEDQSITIGAYAQSRGSNTTTIGNSSTTSSKLFGILNIGTVPSYADNADAIDNGLAVGDVYRTGDILKVVH